MTKTRKKQIAKGVLNMMGLTEELFKAQRSSTEVYRNLPEVKRIQNHPIWLAFQSAFESGEDYTALQAEWFSTPEYKACGIAYEATPEYKAFDRILRKMEAMGIDPSMFV